LGQACGAPNPPAALPEFPFPLQFKLQPNFKLVLMLKTAKARRLDISPSLILRADELSNRNAAARRHIEAGRNRCGTIASARVSLVSERFLVQRYLQLLNILPFAPHASCVALRRQQLREGDLPLRQTVRFTTDRGGIGAGADLS
jgi:hypothetical protein